MKLVSTIDVYGQKVSIKNDLYIRPQYYDAKADGVTDDTKAVQNAINAASQGKGIVYFESGVYLCSTLTLPSNVTLLGSGNSVIKAKGAINGYLLDANNVSHITIDNMIIDGNHSNAVEVKNRFACDNFTMKNCEVRNFNAYNPVQCYGDNVLISGNYVHDTVNCDLIAFSSGEHCVISGNILVGAADTDIVAAAGAKDVTITGNVCIRNTRPLDNAQSIAVAGAENVVVTGNVIKGNNSNIAGVRVYRDPNTQEDNRNISICDNVIEGFSLTQAIVAVYVDSCSISGNLITNCNVGLYLEEISNLTISDNNINVGEAGIVVPYAAISEALISNNKIKGKSGAVTYGVRFVGATVTDVSLVGNKLVATIGYQDISSTISGLSMNSNTGIGTRDNAPQSGVVTQNRVVTNTNPFACHVYVNSNTPVSMRIVVENSEFDIVGNYAYVEPNDKILVTSAVSSGTTWTWIGAQ